MRKFTNWTYFITRLSIGLVGLIIVLFVVFPQWIMAQPDEGWGTPRVVNLLIGINMMMIATVLFVKPFQVWIMRSFAFRATSPMGLIALSLVQAALACAGLSITFVVVAADWLGIDPTRGFGEMRALELAAGLTLLLMTYLMHNKPLQRWIAHFLGERVLGHLQFWILSFTRIFLILTGLASVFLATTADLLGIDSTPGWGHARTIQFCVGLSLLAVGLILQNRAMKTWFMRNSGFRLLSPMQIAVMLIVRVVLTVAGVTVTGMVLFADALGLDPTPGWGRERTMQFLAGLALLFAAFVLHNRPLWKWARRRAATS